ncbi:MAG: DUF3224 domain-containing protein [Rudaea sp.]
MRLEHYITLGVALLAFTHFSVADTATSVSHPGEKIMHAKGPFDVKLAPLEGYNKQLGRMSLDKQFHGDLEAVSQGEMLSFLDREKQSGGYVAIERVTGALGGKKGSFVFQHSSTMTRGKPAQNIIVVPDSGTDGLVGLSGAMVVNIADGGAHSYDFEYTFDETK